MSNIELKHKWKVDPNSWFIRFYLKTWEASTIDLNFCKLFWGYVFAIPCWLIIRPVIFAGEKIHDWSESKKAPPKTIEEMILERAKRREEKEAAGPSRLEHILEKITHFFAILKMKWDTLTWNIGAFISKHHKGFTALAVISGVVAGVAGMGAIVYAVSLVPLKIWLAIAIVICGISVAIVMLIFILWFGLDKTNFFGKLGYFIRRVFYGDKESNKLGLLLLLKHGFIAVKTNTCPEIVIEEEPPHESSLPVV